jgi:hypothetical protein
MSGFHTATICADCDPPIVAISTGSGSRCPRCGQNDAWSLLVTDTCDTRLDGALARQIIRDTAIRSDGDARLLAELARRLLSHAGRGDALKEELAELQDLADLVRDADISKLPPELVAVRQRWVAADRNAKEGSDPTACPHCAAGAPSVWDDVLYHYAHPGDGGKLKFCHNPWRERCRRCSTGIPQIGAPCPSCDQAGAFL